MSYAAIRPAHRGLGAAASTFPRFWAVWTRPQFPGDAEGWHWVGWTWATACQIARLKNIENNCYRPVSVATEQGVVMDVARLRRVCSGQESL